MPTYSDKLSICKEHFDSWRKESAGNSKRRIIPDALWKEAVSLIGTEFTISRVTQELRLNQARLRQKQIELNSASPADNKIKKRANKKTKSNQFIRFDAPLPRPAQPDSFDLRLVVQKQDQTRLERSTAPFTRGAR